MPPRRLARFAAYAAGVAALLLSMLAVASPASAATPQLRVDFSPATVPAGAGAAPVLATLTNPRGGERIGSANLVAPDGFGVANPVLTGTGTATVEGATVKLRGLALSGGSSIVVRFALEVPCPPVTASRWGVQVKRSTTFAGDPIAIAPESALVTGVRGTCTLRWGDRVAGTPERDDREPTNARVGEVITSVPYDESAPRVRVAVHDGDGVRVASAVGDVAVTLDSAVGGGILRGGGTAAFQAPGGYATFPGLNVSGAGTYGLEAAVTTERFKGLTSRVVFIRADTRVRQCTSASCPTEDLRGGRGVFSVGAGSGTDAPFLTLSVDAGVSLGEDQCDGWVGYTSSTALFNVSSDQRTKIISLTIDQIAINEFTDRGAPRLELCFGSPVEFTAKYRVGGALYTTPVTGQFDWDADGRPENVYSGLLPDCSSTVTLCVSKRKKVGAGDGYIEATVPKSIGDPLMRG